MATSQPTVTQYPARPATIAEAPKWARRAAHVTALLAVPNGLWRIGLAFGFPLGYTEQGLHDLVGTSWWGPVKIVIISVLAEAAALLTLGLVQRWGVVTPRWVPFIRGRIIPRRLVLGASWAGVAVLLVLWTPFLFWWTVPPGDMTPAGHLLVGFLYLPLVAWAPLLAAVTISYQRRRRPCPN